RTQSRVSVLQALERIRQAVTKTLCRHTPKVGAVCPNWARTDLCGGRSVMSVPTADSEMSSQIIPLKARADFQKSSRIPATETIRVWPAALRRRDRGLPPRCGYWFRDSPAARASPREHAQVRGRRRALRIRRVLDRGGFWGRLAGRGHCNHRVCGAVFRGRARDGRPYAPCRQGGVAMSALIRVLRQFAGLFVEDGWRRRARRCACVADAA